jgi:hypothetical protein
MQVTINEGNNQLNITMVRILGNLTVTVSDSFTAEPIEGVEVNLDGQVALTDSTGVCLFENIIPGNYNISLDKDGYTPIP